LENWAFSLGGDEFPMNDNKQRMVRFYQKSIRCLLSFVGVVFERGAVFVIFVAINPD